MLTRNQIAEYDIIKQIAMYIPADMLEDLITFIQDTEENSESVGYSEGYDGNMPIYPG